MFFRSNALLNLSISGSKFTIAEYIDGKLNAYYNISKQNAYLRINILSALKKACQLSRALNWHTVWFSASVYIQGK